MKRTLLSLFCLIAPLSLLAQLNKGYGQMEKGMFTEAKPNLLKNRAGSKPGSKDLTEAYFGLYAYYSTEANPEANPDKAWLYLDSTTVIFKEDFKAKYKPYEAAKINRVQLDTLKAHMALRAYNKAENANTVATWKQYIGFYTKSNNPALITKAEKGLHQKAYDDYVKANDLAGLEAFVVEYKTATQVDSALVLIDRLRWKNALKTNTRDAYATFVKSFPTNKKVTEANDTLSAIDYRAITASTTTTPFKIYLTTYPDSKFKNIALSRICLIAYDSVATVNKESALQGFVKDYAGCPQVGIIRDKLERMECERCLAAPTKECLSLVMKNCGSDNAIAMRVNAALMAMVDQNRDKADCEKCLSNPTKACLIQLFKNCGNDSSLVKRADDVLLSVMKKEAEAQAVVKAAPAPVVVAPAVVAAPVTTPPVAPATSTVKTDTTAVKPGAKKDIPPEMENKRKPLTAFIVVMFLFASHFLIDIYKIGIKDGKATKMAAAKELKAKK
jgi:hypothetical protein